MEHVLLTLVVAFAADLAFGDPLGAFHVVIARGKLIGMLEKFFRRLFPKTSQGEFRSGCCTVILVCALSLGICIMLIELCRLIHPMLGFAAECFIGWQCLAAGSLRKESTAVKRALSRSLGEGRLAVGRIVGRDTGALDSAGVCRACVETVAENTSDGVIAPLLYMALGGAPLALLYKAINTMDSMLGYKNDVYLHFGRAAAKLDDAANFIPSRVSALAMIAAAAVLGFDAKNALHIFRRDRFCHASPNSAQTESVCAGALGLRLGGPNMYFGKTADKPYIGVERRPITPEDIDHANELMLGCSIICFIIFFLLRGAVLCLFTVVI